MNIFSLVISHFELLKEEFLKIPPYFSSLIKETAMAIWSLGQEASWLPLLKELLLITLIIITPFLGFYFFKKKLSFHKSYYRKKRKKILPYIPWGILLFSLYLGKKLLPFTLFSSWEFFFPLIFMVFLYKLALKWLTKLFIHKRLSFIEHNRKANKSLFLWGRFVLFYSFFRYLILMITGANNLFLFYEKISFFIFLLLLIKSTWKWREESMKKLAGLPFIGKFFTLLWQTPWHYPLLPLLGTLALFKFLMDSLISLFSHLEIFKKASNQIFKTRLKEAISQDEKAHEVLPATYSCLFNDQSIDDKRLFLNFPQDCGKKLNKLINEWAADRREEHSLALIGPKGSGKTTLLKKISTTLNKTQNIITHTLTHKITTPQDINTMISKILQVDFTGGMENLLEIDKNLSGTIILVDNGHNMFLAKEDGLEALKYFIQIINAQTQNLFWITSFNEHSWLYINNVLGRHQYFRHELFMPIWSEEDMMSFIRKKHSFSDYHLSFDLIAEVISHEDESYMQSHGDIEKKFYRFLCQEAHGIPGLAQALWLSSVKVKAYEQMQVAFPYKYDITKELSDLQDHSLFIYAALLRHENLSPKEVVKVTSLSKGLVFNALNLGLERKFLTKDHNHRYRVELTQISPLTQFLIKKNFIYE